MMRRVFIACCLAVLAGCSNNLGKLDAIDPPANDFDNALAAEYQAYAEAEKEQGRGRAAERFAGKGLKAHAGEIVEPEPADAAADPRLPAAREQLVALLVPDVKKVAAQKLAHAQLLYDCWQQQARLRTGSEQVLCAQEYESTVTEVQDVADFFVYGKAMARSVSFAPGSVKLDAGNRGVLQTIADKVKGAGGYSIEIKAAVGPRASDRKLAAARLSAVKAAMGEAGIDLKAVEVVKEDGSKTVVLSKDKIALDARKVDIDVKISSKKKEGA